MVRLRKSVEFVPQTHGSQVQPGNESTSVASFYRGLIETHIRSPGDSRSKANTNTDNISYCKLCSMPTGSDPVHHLSLVHQLFHPVVDPPVQPLPVSTENIGYKYLVKHGWSPISSSGLGSVGREGKRVPLKVGEVKTDKKGVGKDKISVGKSDRSSGSSTIKVTKSSKPLSAREARKQELANKRRHNRIMSELL
jgi:hypothetical protein